MKNWLLAAFLVAGACKSSASKDTASEGPKNTSDPEAAASASAKPGAAASSGHTPKRQLVFKVDDKHLEVTEPGPDFDLLDLAELPPIGEWKTIIVRSVDGRDFRGIKPALLTGVRTMRVVTLEDGTREFRVIEPSEDEPSGTRIRHKMTDAKSVLVYSKDYVAPPEPKVPSEIAFRCGGKDSVLKADAIGGLAMTDEPGKVKAKATWALADVIKAAGCSPKRGLKLTTRKGETADVTSEQLADANRLHTIKKNRRGRFNYRQWTLGETPERSLNHRDVVRVEEL